MIVGIVRGEPIGEKGLYRPFFNSNLSERANAPSWFVHADYNGDGEVSRREFVASPEQFSSLDRNHDGYIDLEEAEHGGGFTPRVP